MAFQISPEQNVTTAGERFPFFEKLAGPKGSGGVPAKKGGGKKGGGKKGGGKKGGGKKGGKKR